MKTLRDLLEAVIKYQDVIDSKYVGEYLLNMMEKLSKAEVENKEFLSKYNFNYSKDSMKDFDNLQKFINDMQTYDQN